MSSLITCLNNIIKNPSNKLKEVVKSGTRANEMGDTLEAYIKNCFAGTFNPENSEENVKKHAEIFSYQGNQNNPPDLILRNSDAIEVKKIEGTGSLPLNSSYPKAKISSKSNMITKDCKICEGAKDWEKDMIYAVGTVNKENQIKYLFFVYGTVYAASEDKYERIREKIKNGIEEIQGVDFKETNELGKVKKVDPLGITDLRIRGMWSIEHPFKVYDYLKEVNKKENEEGYTIYAIVPKEKYNSFEKNEINELESFSNVSIFKDKKVKNPNNPSIMVDIVLIKINLNNGGNS